MLLVGGILSGLAILPDGAAWASAYAEPVKIITNRRCLRCHNDEDDKTYERDDGTVVNIYIDAEQYEQSVHGDQYCVSCHATIEKAKHRRPLPQSIGCVECHRELQAQLARERPDDGAHRLDVVVAEIDGYMDSVHARPNLRDMSSVNATCFDCHDAHNIGRSESATRTAFRERNPQVCGRCHVDERNAYLASVHGRRHQAAGATTGPDGEPEGHAAVFDATANGADRPPVCSDCHTPHNIDRPEMDPVRLAITDQCGDCHEPQVRTFLASYHGKVTQLGYAHTATCYDCHGSHDVVEGTDPASMVHPDNRLETCRECHADAPAGFVGFHAHGDPDDFERYPEMWIAQRSMELLIIGVFAFFWTHMLLWIYREWHDRRQGKGPETEGDTDERVYFRRFSLGWRLLHLVFALSIMTLVITGMAILFSDQPWARYVMQLIGGPQVGAAVHRIAAIVLTIGFVGHLLVALWQIYRKRRRFSWLGPTSLIPNWGDVRDIGRMFKWFFGMAPRPDFDRWSYWEKFDYWAPFWGMAVIGLSGLMLWFPTQTATMLPGWTFNVAAIVHAEEAVLATVFLFTVHFFNVHFRPNKFPMDIVMVTGAVPLEEFKHEHRLEYERLAASGELDKYLVKGPGERATRLGRKVTGWLIVLGLTLAVLVLTGYLERLLGY
jgi:predicted CXXCH cytochrome family protein